MTNRNFSKQGVALLQKLEGLSKVVYRDSAGYPTIGIGHLLTHDERTSGLINIGGQSISYIMGLTTEQCIQLCQQDAYSAVRALNDTLGSLSGLSGLSALGSTGTGDLTQNQFDALVCWTFNIGNTAMRNSTLVKKLLRGNLRDVPDELRKWNKSEGVVVQGLVNRREAEVICWLGL
jgi:lysozyme